MALRRQTFLDFGCFDEDFYVYNDDVALGRQSRARGFHQRLRTTSGPLLCRRLPSCSSGWEASCSGIPQVPLWDWPWPNGSSSRSSGGRP